MVNCHDSDLKLDRPSAMGDNLVANLPASAWDDSSWAATIVALRMNRPALSRARAIWVKLGEHPPRPSIS